MPATPIPPSRIRIRVRVQPPEVHGVAVVDVVYLGLTDGAGDVIRHRTLAPGTIRLIGAPFPNGFAQVSFGLWDDTGWIPGAFPPGVIADSEEVAEFEKTMTFDAARSFLADPDRRVVAERELDLFTDGVGGGAGDPGPHLSVVSSVLEGGVIVDLQDPIVLLRSPSTSGPRGFQPSQREDVVPRPPVVPGRKPTTEEVDRADKKGKKARKGSKSDGGRKKK